MRSDASVQAVEEPRVFGVHCFTGTTDDAAEAIVERARLRRGGYACFANAHLLTTAARSRDVRDALSGAWQVFPDGAPVSWLLRHGGHATARVPGPDVMPRVLELGAAHGLRHFLFGSSPDVVDRLRRALHDAHPGVEISGTYAPPVDDVDELTRSRGLDAIRLSEPHVVWCALGAPKQELFMRRTAERLFPSVLVGVGAAFDFLSGTKPRAPEWMRDNGLEWLHRARLEPRRLGRRYLVTNTEFLIRAAIMVSKPRTR